ncbi:diiron oxygenase [Ferrovum sp.]|uniref:diiron oxygenase n=1 Tax=Ferrovum sp. TaxID=2609467 RepID=UPI0026255B64|nr:diiron oxygenase [Ferrovum sp.]
MNKLLGMSKSLSEKSIKGLYNPYELEWPDALPEGDWCLSPELISLHASLEYDAMDERDKKRLAFHEVLNLFSVTMHGERSLVSGLANYLYSDESFGTSEYIHHFLDEENKHMIYFGRFLNQYGKVYPDVFAGQKKVADRNYAEGEESLLFFIKAFVFELVSDEYNQVVAADTRINDLVRYINHNHHVDESRHIAFGRQMIVDLYERGKAKWSADTMKGVRTYIAQFMNALWGAFYNTEVYVDAGISNAKELRDRVFSSQDAREFRALMSVRPQRFLCEIGVLEEPVTV